MKKASGLPGAFKPAISAIRAKPMKIKLAVLILTTVGLCIGVHAGQLPAVAVTSLLFTRTAANGQLIKLPVYPEVVVSIYEIPPNAALPIHEHPYQRYAYVLARTIEITVLGGETYRYKPGDFIAEVVAQWHSVRTIAPPQSGCWSSTRSCPAIPIRFFGTRGPAPESPELGYTILAAGNVFR